jgi:hypothetical protein
MAAIYGFSLSTAQFVDLAQALLEPVSHINLGPVGGSSV